MIKRVFSRRISLYDAEFPRTTRTLRQKLCDIEDASWNAGMVDAVTHDKWARFHPWMDKHAYLKRYNAVIRRFDRKPGRFAVLWRLGRYMFALDMIKREQNSCETQPRSW